MEHLGRCIYGGVFDENSPLSNERGYRSDVLEAAKNLRIPILRWPGGNFISGYHCETVKMANLAQMVNVIAPIFTNEDDLFLQTIYHPLKLCAEHMHEVVLDAFVECETHDLTTEASSWAHRVADLGPFDLLDVSATCDAEGRDLTLLVVNRNPDREIETTIQLADATFEGGAMAYEVTGESYGSINSFDRQAVGVSERSAQTGGESFEHSFPACSVTVLRAGLAG